jgi:serine/threonine-protein kinase
LLTITRGAPADSRIAVVGPEGGEVREILSGTMAHYAATGHVVYTTADGTLMAAPFDVRRLEVTGPPVALVDGVLVKGSSASLFALSESGTLLYGTGAGAAVAELVWVSRAGEVEPVDPAWTGDFSTPALSPDGARLAVTIRDQASWDVWVKQLDRVSSPLKLTFEGTDNDFPTWTPDGASVTFYSNQAGPSQDLWTKRADGSAQAVLELDQDRGLRESLWSPDGEWLVYRNQTSVDAGDILALRPERDTVPVPLVATGFTERTPTLSPDGRWMAYQSDETGRFEIYVVPFPNASDARWVVSTGGGTEPVWSRGGGELFYRNGQGDMVAVRVETEPTFSPGPTSVLFSATEYRASGGHRGYDVTADGERFIMIRMIRPLGGGQTELILVLNWFEELRARVPN